MLADEVGLGKTIEAGLVLCQYWAERKRRLLVICPASLRKQWSLEIQEKFNLPTVILDARTYRHAQQEGNPKPFLTDGCGHRIAELRQQDAGGNSGSAVRSGRD